MNIEQNINILVIDDSVEDRDLITRNIKKESKNNLTIDESDCLTSALKKIQTNEYDIIILDIKLPETEGIETIKIVLDEIKKSNKIIPVIVLTGIEDYKIGVEAWMLGIKDFLIKKESLSTDLSRSLSFALKDNANNEKRKLLMK